jgi:hypothetical protein
MTTSMTHTLQGKFNLCGEGDENPLKSQKPRVPLLTPFIIPRELVSLNRLEEPTKNKPCTTLFIPWHLIHVYLHIFIILSGEGWNIKMDEPKATEPLRPNQRVCFLHA